MDQSARIIRFGSVQNSAIGSITKPQQTGLKRKTCLVRQIASRSIVTYTTAPIRPVLVVWPTVWGTVWEQ